MSSFYVIEGPDRGRRYELLPNRAETIGREEGATVQLHDTEVSRKHARIIYDSGRYLITDLNSSNGTFVNQVRITTAAINSGDKISVGATCLLFTQTPIIEQDDSGASSISFELPNDDHSQIVQTMRHTEDGRPFSVQDCQSFLSSSLDKTGQAETYLRLVYETATALKSTGTIDDLMEKILDLIFQWINPDRGCIILSEPHTHELQVRCYRIREKGVREKMSISRTILDYVISKNEGVVTRNAMDDARFDSADSILHQKVSEAICVPLDGRYGVVGVIYIDTEANDDALNNSTFKNTVQGKTAHFDENHLKMMVAIAHHAAIAIEDIRFYSAMIQSERLAAIGQTVANLSHHIKNILQGVSGGSYLIETGLKNHDEKLISKGWGIVERNQGKISSLVMDMLTFSKERTAEPALDNMNDALDEVVELMKPRAEEFNVALTWVRNEKFPEFYFDRNLINRAVLNLITNAIDAAAENVSNQLADMSGASKSIPQGVVSVTLSWGEIPTNVRISVADNGAGVPANQVEQIFTPFVSTKGSKGTGLGLPVVKKVVSEHGGTVTCVPLEKGGTVFHIDLPFRKDPETDPDTGEVEVGEPRV